MSSQGIQVDEGKIRVIQEGPSSTNISQVESFHGIPSFYWRNVMVFCSIDASLTEVTKKNVGIKWVEQQEREFQLL